MKNRTLIASGLLLCVATSGCFSLRSPTLLRAERRVTHPPDSLRAGDSVLVQLDNGNFLSGRVARTGDAEQLALVNIGSLGGLIVAQNRRTLSGPDTVFVRKDSIVEARLLRPAGRMNDNPFQRMTDSMTGFLIGAALVGGLVLIF